MVAVGGQSLQGVEVLDEALRFSDSKIIVVLPDLHRSGGPQHFHMVNSGLNRLGFDSEMFFVNPYYQDEYSKNISQELLDRNNASRINPDMLSSKDILILPCRWSLYISEEDEAVLRGKGVRFMVIVTAVAFPEETMLLNLLDYSRGTAVPFACSHYMHHFYQLPWNWEKHVIWPPIANWVIEEYHKYNEEKRAGKAVKKEDHILMDPDAKSGVVVPTDKPTWTKLFKLNRTELINEFKRSKIIHDVYLNGLEHMPREAVLFDCIPVLTMSDNGYDAIDFPLEQEYLVDELDHDFSAHVLEGVLEDYESIVHTLQPFKEAVLQRPKQLLSNLMHTFSSRFLLFRIIANSYAEEECALISALQILTHLPMASVELLVRPSSGLRLLRRAGPLTKRLLELGLTTKLGGTNGHSLRIIESDHDMVHGDLLITMQSPVYFYDFKPLVEIGKQVLLSSTNTGRGTRARNRFRVNSREGVAGEEILITTLDFRRSSCETYGEGSGIELEVESMQGFASMNTVLYSKQSHAHGPGVAQVCESLCKLSKNPAWHSTGFFHRVFGAARPRRNERIQFEFNDGDVLRKFSCDVNIETYTTQLCVQDVLPRSEGVTLELCEQIVRTKLQDKVSGPICTFAAYNNVCARFCEF